MYCKEIKKWLNENGCKKIGDTITNGELANKAMIVKISSHLVIGYFIELRPLISSDDIGGGVGNSIFININQ